jgi:hypothetical protein
MTQGSKSVMRVSGADAEALLSERPAARGFWTDEELLADTGLGSVALLKKVQATRWLWPNYIPLAGGGRRRVWPQAEVIRASILADLADAMSLNVIGLSALLARAGVEWVEAAVQVKVRLKRERPDHEAKASRLVVVEYRSAWAEQENGDFRLISEGMNLQGTVPEIPQVKGRPTLRSAAAVERSGTAVLIANMGMLHVRAMTSVLDLEPQTRLEHRRR